MAATSPALSTGRESRLPSLVDKILMTDARLGPAIARLALGLVMFPHGAQKALGWYGGPGFGGAYGMFMQLGIPAPLAVIAVFTELVCSVALILGIFTRIAALGIIAMMLGAIGLVHRPNGFFMNWMGTQAGEGFEFHILAIALALVCVASGGGRASIDRLLVRARARIRLSGRRS